MYTYFLLLRFKQGKRYLNELGIVRLVVLSAILVYAVIGLESSLKTEITSYAILSLALLSILTLHLQRTDKNFLSHFPLKKPLLFSIEYLILSSVCVLIFLWNLYWLPSFALILGSIGIAFIPTKKQALNLKVVALPFLNNAAFEWKSGIRRSAFTILLVFVLSFGFASIPYITPISIIILSLIFTGFYREGEPLSMLEIVSHSPKNILWFKTRWALLHLLLISSPLIVLFIFLHIEWWYLLVYALLASSLILTFSIIFKYALYEPNQDLSLNSFLVGFVSFSFIIPFLAPIPLFMIVVYARKALKNLKLFL